MELVKDHWSSEDISQFQKFLYLQKNAEKINWTKNILNTEMEVLAIKTPEIKKIASKIYKGNYIEFLDWMIWEYYENALVNGFLISKIKDFNVMKHYLDIYSSKVDSWATCDLLSFNVKNNEAKFLNITLEYIKSDKPFVRRIGMSILFKFIDNDKYINKIFELLDSFKYEENYYVNMMNAWLLCECFVKQKDKTLEYLKHNKLNKFTINKGIQKCRESYRVSIEDKELLKKYKIK